MSRFIVTSLRWGLPLVIACAAVTAAGQGIYPSTPDWESIDSGVSTGAALVDLDRDGWLDLVVANGNDMIEQHLVVYYNNGDGTFPTTRDWQSDDVDYNGHLDVADVNGDGWPDVAVSVLGQFEVAGVAAKLYLNNNGTLSATPDWQSDVITHAFGCAFGDVNNDGRPDLAVATGWAYSSEPFDYHQLLYLNNGGTLSATADWVSDDEDHLQGGLWTDADRDGWLDFVGIAYGAQTRVYRNLGGTLETTASWSTTDSADQDGIMVVAGDVNGDGHSDLITADNNQLTGSGLFRQYDGLPGGFYETTHGWTYDAGLCSAVALADVDADGRLDLATGAWWDSTRLFLNTGTGLPPTPDWSSATSRVIEKIVFGDVDNDAPRVATEVFPATGERLFHLARRPIQEVVSVQRDGVPMAPDEFVLDRDDGWVTVAAAPTVALEVRYRWSTSQDMTVSNWDELVGNYLYYNRLGALFTDDFESGNTLMWSATVQ